MHYIVLYPQNGDRIITIESVTSLHPMLAYTVFDRRYARHILLWSLPLAWIAYATDSAESVLSL